jgi:hypothetical protein
MIVNLPQCPLIDDERGPTLHTLRVTPDVSMHRVLLLGDSGAQTNGPQVIASMSRLRAIEISERLRSVADQVPSPPNKPTWRWAPSGR